MFRNTVFAVLLFFSSLCQLHANIDWSRVSAGAYTEYPLANGAEVRYTLSSDYFLNLKYGVAPQFYMEQMGDILSYFDWWNDLYSELLTETLTGMKGFTIGIGKNNVFKKKNVFVYFGTSVYTLDYNSLTTSLLNDLFGLDIPDDGRSVRLLGKLVAVNLNIGKTFPLKHNWSVDAVLSVNRIVSVYSIGESDFLLNDSVSYSLSKWFKDNLETLTLPTVGLSLKKQF